MDVDNDHWNFKVRGDLESIEAEPVGLLMNDGSREESPHVQRHGAHQQDLPRGPESGPHIFLTELCGSWIRSWGKWIPGDKLFLAANNWLGKEK